MLYGKLPLASIDLFLLGQMKILFNNMKSQYFQELCGDIVIIFLLRI